jgi:AraC-like DNA-binding protein
LLFGIGAFTASPSGRSEAGQGTRQWLEERYKEATSVRAGMSRAELLRVFDEDGGLQRIPASRYVLRSCRMIKVDVEFDVGYGQAYRVKPDKELKIKGISKPYLEHMYAD